MAAALHGATFKKAKDLRQTMTEQQLKEFAGAKPESHTYNWRSRNNLKRGKE